MKNEIIIHSANNIPSGKVSNGRKYMGLHLSKTDSTKLPEILFITSYPPRGCGIATYSQDLITALNNKFNHSFEISICALESASEQHHYIDTPKYRLNCEKPNSFLPLAEIINKDTNIKLVILQHEFGFFNKHKVDFNQFLHELTKPLITVFHTVLPKPDNALKTQVQYLADVSDAIVVMTHSSSNLLMQDYQIDKNKINVIPHGTHLVSHTAKETLKIKYQLSNKKILATFGLLGSGKNIETTLNALPLIAKIYPEILFLIIGQTHPNIIKQEGEKYRNLLKAKVIELKIEKHVQFINHFLPLNDLLEYLQLTDIYLFTSKDPNQAVSGTFSYAMSCGCAIISTPIPHACEVLQDDAGIIIDFENSTQLAEAVILLLNDKELTNSISLNGLHKITSTVWENSAIAHALLFKKISTQPITLHYNIPPINLKHIKKMTTDVGIIQFSKINHPDIHSGYTLDDNARALIAMCQHYEQTLDPTDLKYINIYFNFIKHCLQADGYFLNYVNEQQNFTKQNQETNLADANGRAIWAIGYLISLHNLFSQKLIEEAEEILQKTLKNIHKVHSTRAMAFIIKGLYYYHLSNSSQQHHTLIKELANRLVQMYKHEANNQWQWFESYLTYANSILPEAMLCAWLITHEEIYLETAKTSFDFLLSKIFTDTNINVISNKGWLHKGAIPPPTNVGGEQPIDIAYTILALHKFNEVFHNKYLKQMHIAFSWFLGNNHLHQIIYNPCTGGCYDGLEENCVNLNQGAESTVSYIMAALTIQQVNKSNHKIIHLENNFLITNNII